jgi:2,4-dienoyl-CoA reductase-like NADH-dependent reductase (Old Yellow Enzyme family)
MTADSFLAAIDAFLARTRMKESAFGREAVRDPSLVRKLRAGRSPSLRLVGRVEEFMQSRSRPRRARKPRRKGAR